jgi:plasmid stabilization system protein ParE
VLRLVLRASFVRDVDVRVAWLEENAPLEWLERFRDGLTSVTRRIAAYPRSGTPLQDEAGLVLRAMAFPGRLPYLVYYTHPSAEPIDDVYLLRLFHYRQRRTPRRLSEWPS